ncbi:MAG: DUF4149 domain-containing protein [Verrucomicrobiae bacterium]|nr:DUF4149 domain-containing protein [Verrucomicrobiae bacterium]
MALLSLGVLLGCLSFSVFVVDPVLANPDVASGLSEQMRQAICGATQRRDFLIAYVAGGVAAFFLLLASFNAKMGRGPRRALVLVILMLGLNAGNDLYVKDRLSHLQVRITNSDHAGGFRDQLKRWRLISTVTFAATLSCCLLAALFLLPSGAPPKGGRGGK